MKANLKLLNLPNFESLKTRKVSDYLLPLTIKQARQSKSWKGNR